MKRIPEVVSFLLGVVMSLVVLNVMTGTDAFEKYSLTDSGNHLERQTGGDPFDCSGTTLNADDMCSTKSQTVMVTLTRDFAEENSSEKCKKLKWSSGENVNLKNKEHKLPTSKTSDLILTADVVAKNSGVTGSVTATMEGPNCDCGSTTEKFFIEGEIDRLTFGNGNGQGQNENNNENRNNNNQPNQGNGGNDAGGNDGNQEDGGDGENQETQDKAVITVGESVDLTAKFHKPTKCKVKLSVEDEDKRDGVSFEENPISTGAIDQQSASGGSGKKASTSVTGDKVGTYEIVAEEKCGSSEDNSSGNDSGGSNSSSITSGDDCDDTDKVTLVVEKPQVELTIERVPGYVFSDADFWVPIKAKISGIPKGINKVIIKEVNARLSKGENNDIYKISLSLNKNNKFVKWGIGNGTTDQGSPCFKDTHISVRNPKSNPDPKDCEELNEKTKGKIRDGEVVFTAFVNNKKAMNDLREVDKNVGQGPHLFTKNNDFEVPKFQLKSYIKLRHGKEKKGKGTEEVLTGSEDNLILLSNKKSPKLIADTNIPAIDLEEDRISDGIEEEPGVEEKELGNKFYDTDQTDVTLEGKKEFRHAPNQTHWRLDKRTDIGGTTAEFYEPYKGLLAQEWHTTKPKNLSLTAENLEKFGLKKNTKIAKINTAFDGRKTVNAIKGKDGIDFPSIDNPLEGVWAIGHLKDLGSGERIDPTWVDSGNTFKIEATDWGLENNRVRGHVNAVRNGVFVFLSFGGWKPSDDFVSMDLNKREADRLIIEMGRVSLQGEYTNPTTAFKDYRADILKELTSDLIVGLISYANPTAGVVAGIIKKISQTAIEATENKQPKGEFEGEGVITIGAQEFDQNGDLLDDGDNSVKYTTNTNNFINKSWEMTTENSRARKFTNISVGQQLKVFFQLNLFVGMRTGSNNQIKGQLGVLYESIAEDGKFRVIVFK